jgi:DNA-binding response OmpR family regulator
MSAEKRIGSKHHIANVDAASYCIEAKYKLAGLQLRADDYLAKLFARQELLAGIRALSRRHAEEPALVALWKMGPGSCR